MKYQASFLLSVIILLTGITVFCKSIKNNTTNNGISLYQTIDSIDKRDNYKIKLLQVIFKLNSKEQVSDNDLLFVVPTSEEEYLIFYSLTYPDNDKSVQSGFNKLNSEIIAKAKEGIETFFKAFLQLSQFVDGEYAESYFENVEIVISCNVNYFCEVFPSLPKNSAQILLDSYDNHCKQ